MQRIFYKGVILRGKLSGDDGFSQPTAETPAPISFAKTPRTALETARRKNETAKKRFL